MLHNRAKLCRQRCLNGLIYGILGLPQTKVGDFFLLLQCCHCTAIVDQSCDPHFQHFLIGSHPQVNGKPQRNWYDCQHCYVPCYFPTSKDFAYGKLARRKSMDKQYLWACTKLATHAFPPSHVTAASYLPAEKGSHYGLSESTNSGLYPTMNGLA